MIGTFDGKCSSSKPRIPGREDETPTPTLPARSELINIFIASQKMIVRD